MLRLYEIELHGGEYKLVIVHLLFACILCLWASKQSIYRRLNDTNRPYMFFYVKSDTFSARACIDNCGLINLPDLSLQILNQMSIL